MRMVTFESLLERRDAIAVIGLGYVGLPLAVHLAQHFTVVGFDLKSRRVSELRAAKDRTREVPPEMLRAARLRFTDDPADLAACRLFVVAVPTPIDAHRIPDLEPLRQASRTVGERMRAGSCVVFESTVYPGATEEVCVPILCRHSGLACGPEFTVGYSPERINPGDRDHTLETIMKVVAGSDAPTRQLLARVYGQVVQAGIHEAPSIRVAEAAKVIENTQRDLNIALMNELSLIFDRMGIDTREVLAAAETKWNFLRFRPGLVGGHCIGVDPYYLTFKAEAIGYHPEVILAGRRINDNMGRHVAQKAVKLLIGSGRRVQGARVGLLGLTFKEDVPDLRNTRVVDIIAELRDYGVEVLVHDPLADAEEARSYYGLDLSPWEGLRGVDAVIVAVGHSAYQDMGLAEVLDLCHGERPLLLDLKGIFGPREVEARHGVYWRL
jgi:UDP-N-acetyl-D-galactosamine dehydrogenase